MARKFDDAARARMVAMHNDGESQLSIAKTLGARPDTVARILREEGFRSGRVVKDFGTVDGETDEQREERLAGLVVSSYLNGEGLASLEKKSGFDRKRLQGIIRSRGVICPDYELYGDEALPEFHPAENAASRRAKYRRIRHERKYGDGYLTSGKTLEEI